MNINLNLNSRQEFFWPALQHPLGRGVGLTCIGASHKRDNIPCQDAAGGRQLNRALLVALADGHGDPKHDRSHIGSRFAVQAALDELEEVIIKTPGDTFNKIVKSLPRACLRRWRDFIRHDATLNGLDADDEKISIRYGSTLLAAAYHDCSLHLVQIGDGDFLLLRPDGSIESPIPPQTDGIGTVTNSLCSSNAALCWQIACINKPPSGSWLLLSSDGLINSFPDNTQYHSFCRSLVDRIDQYGLDEVTAALPGWLDVCSTRGSGDDIALVLVKLEHLPNTPSPPSPHHIDGNSHE